LAEFIELPPLFLIDNGQLIIDNYGAKLQPTGSLFQILRGEKGGKRG